jgi:hypothetical protein
VRRTRAALFDPKFFMPVVEAAAESLGVQAIAAPVPAKALGLTIPLGVLAITR